MARFFFTILLTVAVSGIVVAQNTKTRTATDVSNTTSAQRQGRQIDLQSGTQLAAQLQGALDARHTRVGDRVILKTTDAVKQDGHVIIPKGAQLIGRVTDVQQRTKDAAESHIGLLFDQIRSGSIEIPITASILSITQASNHTQANNSSVDTDLMGQSTASTRTASPPRNQNGGGL